MSSQTSTSFDLARFCQAVEERDVETQAAMYAPDATVTIADRITQPGSPRMLRGGGEIRAWIADVCGRDMSHAVKHAVQDQGGAAFAEACRYADGTNVTCAAVMALKDGVIVDQTVVQAWDET
jgi:ketosteroid isomerase-like protein